MLFSQLAKLRRSSGRTLECAGLNCPLLTERCRQEVNLLKGKEGETKAAITAAAEKTKRLIDEQVSELYVEYDKATALGETTREITEITVTDVDEFVVLCDELLDKGISVDITRAARQLYDQAAELLSFLSFYLFFSAVYRSILICIVL